MTSEHLAVNDLYAALLVHGIDFFCGVPDSTLSAFGDLVNRDASDHLVAANEGSAVGFAVGHYLATGRPGLVYLQNSGLGNALNPLVSLADKHVMGIPMVLLVGWRGKPGMSDEPQHYTQGNVTLPLLETLAIPHRIMSRDRATMERQVAELFHHATTHNTPVALVVEVGTFALESATPTIPAENLPTREAAIETIISSLQPMDIIVATTGKASRELFELREARGERHDRDLLIVGGMGHASAIACQIARDTPDRTIYIIDGDGALLMHMGALATIAGLAPPNLRHIVIHNETHESVGGLPTTAPKLQLASIAEASGYAACFSISTLADVQKTITKMRLASKTVFIEIHTTSGSRAELGRPTISPADNKRSVMGNLNKTP
jgi:phosphonopyruvate decarboxylase